MKKTVKIAALLMAFALIAGLLAGCGSSYNANDMKGEWFESAVDAPAAAPEEYYESADGDFSYNDYGSDEAASAVNTADGGLIATGQSSSFAEKLIYTAYADIETLDFEGSISDMQAMLNTYEAFLESSYISGNSYDAEFYGYRSTRYANFTIRVPKENYNALTGALDRLGNVTGLNTSVENITEQYTDVNSRLQTYRTEEERLLAMLEKAETVEDMITIESRLSEVRYSIESLTATLRNWDNQVNYSTVSIRLQEVEKLTEQVTVQRTYGEKMRDGLVSSLKSIGWFFSDLLLWLVAALPVILILVVVVVVLLLIIRACLKRRKVKKQARFNPVDGTPVNPENKAE